MEITPEMRKHNEERTRDHINRVVKFGEKIKKDFTQHDASKFESPEADPYVWVSWKHKMQHDGVKLDLSPEIDAQCRAATFHHITHNRHHPEYWDNDMNDTKRNPNGGANTPAQIVDATMMPLDAIQEMCCDWCAMSEELNNSPHEWADKVIETRFKFTPHQIFLIYSTLDSLWETKKGTQSC